MRQRFCYNYGCKRFSSFWVIAVPPIALLQGLYDWLELGLTNLGSFTCLTLLESLSDAKNDTQTGVKSGACFLGHEFG